MVKYPPLLQSTETEKGARHDSNSQRTIHTIEAACRQVSQI